MFSRDRFLPAMLGRAHQKPVWPEPGLLLTRRWREMDSNYRYRIRNNPFGCPRSVPQFAFRNKNRAFRAGDRWFESISLQRRVCLSPGAAFEGREPRFPRGCARLAWRPGRQRHAGCFKIAPTGGNISVAPYSSTAVPLMGSASMRRPHKVGAFAEA